MLVSKIMEFKILNNMGIRNIIFGIKQHLMPTVSGIEAQHILMREIGGVNLLWLHALVQ